MAAYFLDASALVKRYVTETGTPWVTGLLDPAARNRLYMTAARKHGLRGYDAVQLAAAIHANNRRVARKLTPLVFVTADSSLPSCIRCDRSDKIESAQL